VDRLARALPSSVGLQREVDHHDRSFDDADQRITPTIAITLKS
jgi:hypothetical protein